MTIACPIQSSLNTKAIQDGIEWDESLWLENRAEEIKALLMSKHGYKLGNVTYQISDVIARIYDDPDQGAIYDEALSDLLRSLPNFQILSTHWALRSFIKHHAGIFANQLAADELAAKKDGWDD